jgi:hypothetical protein
VRTPLWKQCENVTVIGTEMKLSFAIILSCLLVLIITGGSCKKDPTGPPVCDTCNVDTTHHPTPNDTTSHTFTWSQSTLSGEGILTGCWVFGPKNIYVVGGSIWKWNGTNWNEDTVQWSRGTLHGLLSGSSLFAFSEKDMWITNGGVVLHVVGSYAVRFDVGGSLHSSWGTSSANMYSVGDGGTILHFDGTNWTRMASGTTKKLQNVWGTDNQHIWAAGWDVNHAISELLRYDGISWREESLETNGEGYKWGLGSIWACDSAGTCVAFSSGSQLFRKTSLAEWREDDSDRIGNRGSDGGYIGVTVRGNSPNDLIVGGNWGFLSHWNGKSWHVYPDFYDYTNNSFGIGALSMKDNSICVVGLKNGASWIAIGQRK